jgi:hypothetical protein
MFFRSILQNAMGEFEVGRTLLISSGIAGITTPIFFEFMDLYHNGWHFDVTAWCLAYPGGLGALASFGIYAIGRKDRDVAISRQTAAQPPLDDKSPRNA